MLLLAQLAGGWTIGNIAIAVVVIISIIAVVWVVAKASGIPIPPWLIHVAWICLLAFVAVIAIRFLMSL